MQFLLDRHVIFTENVKTNKVRGITNLISMDKWLSYELKQQLFFFFLAENFLL
jgi:hypothetical protein